MGETALIYFKASTNTGYGIPLLAAIKEKFPAVITFDIDIESDQQLYSYAKELAAKSEFSLAIIDAQTKSPEANKAGLIGLLNHFRKMKTSTVLIGSESLIEKMMKPIPESFQVQNEEEALDLVIKKLDSIIAL